MVREWSGTWEQLTWSLMACGFLEPYGSGGSYFCKPKIGYPHIGYPHMAVYKMSRGEQEAWVAEVSDGGISGDILEDMSRFVMGKKTHHLPSAGDFARYERQGFKLFARRVNV